jgi:hypothetical protein
MTWDYFISHASDDKDLVVAPFAHYLKSSGFQVWYDDFSLKVGDSLLGSISVGLRDSKFGITVFSPSFFEKKWAQQELAGLFSLETSGEKRILPIWHKVGPKEVAAYSPMLADRVAVDTRKGLQAVAEAIVSASFPDKVDCLPISSIRNTNELEAARAREVLRNLFQGNPSISDVYVYLSGYPILLQNIHGYTPSLVPGFKLPGPLISEFASLLPHGVTGPIEVLFIHLGPLTYDEAQIQAMIAEVRRALGKRGALEHHPANEYLESPYFGEYQSMLEIAEAIRSLVPSHNIHWERPETWSFKNLILAGRRGEVDVQKRSDLAKSSGLRVEIASYDRLLGDKESVYR